MLQKLATKNQASSEGPSRARELLPLARAEHDRHKEDEEDIELPEEPGKADNKKTSGLKDKKSKRIRKKKKESSSDSSDKDEGSEDGELELFGSAGVVRLDWAASSRELRLAAPASSSNSPWTPCSKV